MSEELREQSSFYVENHSRHGFEPWITRYLCEPLAKRIPPRVHPNTISLLNHAVCWLVFVVATAAPYLSPFNALAARIVAAIGVFSSLLLDCLDGMHARNTGQTSKLGEVMDHWLDALNVPLMAAGMIMTLGLDPFTLAIAAVLTPANYNAQLVLYHHTGRFVHATTSGVDGQVYLTLAYLVCAVFFFYCPQDLRWVWLIATMFAWSVIAIALRVDYFYVKRLKRLVSFHVIYLFFCCLLSALYLKGMMNAVVFIIGIAIISFRLTGSYVLKTVIRQSYGGADWRIGLWMLAIAAGHFWLEPYRVRGFSVRSVVPFLFILHMTALNLLDLAKSIPLLKAQPDAELAPVDPHIDVDV